jgi:hypothetical protein
LPVRRFAFCRLDYEGFTADLRGAAEGSVVSEDEDEDEA